MRIAFVVTQFPCLSETSVLRQVTGLLDRGHEVEIFAYNASAEPIVHEDVEKYQLRKRTHYLSTTAGPNFLRRSLDRLIRFAEHLSRSPGPVLRSLSVPRFGREAVLLRIFCQIAPFLGKPPYDIVHCQFGPLGQLGLILKDLGVFHGKLVTSFRGYDISSYVRSYGSGVYRELFRRGDLFLCVSSAIRDKLIKLGCEENKVFVHRSGIDPANLRYRACRVQKDEKRRVATVARLVEKKGLEYAIRAVAHVARRTPTIEYRIAGEGPLRGELQRLINDLGMDDRVELLGWKSEREITALLDQSDILLAPSVTSETGDEEGIPGAIMEAFAHGLPVISTAHAGIPEVVHDGQSGFLVPERNAGALAEKLQALVDQPALCARMGASGRDFIESNCDINKLNDRLVTLYRQLLNDDVPTLDVALEPA